MSSTIPYRTLGSTGERVSAIGGVQYAAFAWGVPLTGNNWPATVEIEGQPAATKASERISLPLRSVTADYFKLLGLAMTDGRDFRSSDIRGAPPVAVVNRALADRYFPQGNAVGVTEPVEEVPLPVP